MEGDISLGDLDLRTEESPLFSPAVPDKALKQHLFQGSNSISLKKNLFSPSPLFLYTTRFIDLHGDSHGLHLGK